MNGGLFGAVWLAAAACSASAAQAATVTVQIGEVASAKGRVLVALCDEATFLKRCAHVAAVPAKRGAVSVSFTDIPPGRYAVMTYHDENGDKRLNRSLIGVPTEGVGFSGHAKGIMGPPKFADAAVMVTKANATLAVDLLY
ncbi:MAG TPA: DUF2141 domain-containing protein [Caulobacterales bacterium]|jgi:uncharacterized protein (DUF2141 family)|nr:DUF2141 domain-containing protein [Caulobacterales bacterium]